MENSKLLKLTTLDLINSFKKNQKEITQIYSEEIGYLNEDIDFLFEDLYKFLFNFPEMFEIINQKWNSQKDFYKKWEPNSEYVKVPWGNVLLCSPSNSVIPVVPALITGFCSVGNNLIVAPSRKSIKTSRFVFDLLKNICKDWSFEFFDKGGENAIKEYVLNNKVKLLYFQGSSKNRTNIYSECIKSGVDLIFEGEGNQITIIEDIPDNSNINNLTTIIHKAKTVCNGQLCTAPNTVFISKHVLNLFIESYKKIDNNMEVFDFENITKKEIESILNNEILSVKLRLIAYENFDAVIKSINLNYHFGLQVSFFGKSQDEWKEKILKNIPVGRLTLNMNPIYQNSLLPWGGYNKSGYSNVVNILEKATKFVIIEK